MKEIAILAFLFAAFLASIMASSADAQSYFKGPALIQTPTQTTTSSGTTVLTKDSQTIQVFVGTDPETVELPDATTLPIGRPFQINNRTTANMQVNYGDGSAAFVLLPNSQANLTLVSNTLDEGVWDVSYVLGALGYVLDGVLTSVSQDTGTPANSTPLPVIALDSSGVPITPASEATLQDILTAVDSIDTKTPALIGGNVPVDVQVSVLPTGASTAAKQDDIITAINTFNTDFGTVDFATSAKQDTQITEAQSTNTTLTTIDGKLPATLGQTTASGSLAVVPASDYIPPSPGVPAAVTVKQAAITVGTSAVRLTTDGSAPSATRRMLQFMLSAASSANCFFGSSSVTTSSTTAGVQVWPGANTTFTNDPNDYYIICDTAAQTVYVTEAE